MTGLLLAVAGESVERGRLIYAPCIALAAIAVAAVIAFLERRAG